MDGYHEKKWFVYLGDHHEGPFSVDEIQDKVSSGDVNKTTYVWAEGMADWVPMIDVDALAALALEKTAPVASSGDLTPQHLELETQTPVKQEWQPEQSMDSAFHPVALEAGAQRVLDPRLQARKQVQVHGISTVSHLPRLIKKTVILGALGYGGFFAYQKGWIKQAYESPAFRAGLKTANDLSRPYLLAAAEKFPLLERWISPIPFLPDVSSEDFAQLKAAAKAPLRTEGPKVAVGVSTADASAPSFYVTTNLQDGAWLELYLEGVPDTLLNQLNFTVKAQIQISRNIGKSAPIRFTDGKQIPRGQYIVYVTESALQPPAVKTVLATAQPANQATINGLPRGRLLGMLPRGMRLVTGATYFLGGKKDSIYLTRLKDFHDRLREKAHTELTEIRQFESTLEARLNTTNMKFLGFKKPKITPQQKKLWGVFHSQWKKMSDQLNVSFTKWTPDAIQNDYFYGNLYALTQQAAETVEKVHSLQGQFFSGVPDRKSFEIQLGEGTSSAKGAISKLKAKIEEYEKLPPTPNGMPRREGL